MTETAKATIEVTLYKSKGGDVLFNKYGTTNQVRPEHKVTPLNDAARKMLNPEPPEWLAKMAEKMIENRYPEGLYTYKNTGHRDKWLNVARVAAKFAATELKNAVEISVMVDCPWETNERIKELENA